MGDQLESSILDMGTDWRIRYGVRVFHYGGYRSTQRKTTETISTQKGPTLTGDQTQDLQALRLLLVATISVKTQ